MGDLGVVLGIMGGFEGMGGSDAERTVGGPDNFNRDRSVFSLMLTTLSAINLAYSDLERLLL